MISLQSNLKIQGILAEETSGSTPRGTDYGCRPESTGVEGGFPLLVGGGGRVRTMQRNGLFLNGLSPTSGSDRTTAGANAKCIASVRLPTFV